MDGRIKNLIDEMSNSLREHSLKFLFKKLQDEEQLSDILNLILSAHLSSLCNVMKFIAEDHEEISITTKKFLTELLLFISNCHPVKEMEII